MGRKTKIVRKPFDGAEKSNLNLGVKKSERQKLKKGTLLKALAEKSFNVVQPSKKNSGKRRKYKVQDKIVSKDLGTTNHGTSISSVDVVAKNKKPQPKSNSTEIVVGESSHRTKKRQKKRKQIPLPPTKIEEKKIASSTSKSRKRRNRKPKTAMMKSIPVTTASSTQRDVECECASSNSEPELIDPDWQLASDSSVESFPGFEVAGDESEDNDLDTSREDHDEEVPESDSGSDSISAGGSSEDDTSCDSDESLEKSPNMKQDKDIKNPHSEKNQEKPKVSEAKKSFRLSDKATILKEIGVRSAESNSRSLYLSPIPSNCTFEMIKKFIPKMTCCRFSIKPKSKKLRTYVFVEFDDAETAAKEKIALSGRLFAGQTVRAELRSLCESESDAVGSKTVESIDFSRILITSLVPSVNLLDLQTIFPAADSIRMPLAADKSNYGFAVLKYVSDAVALDAFSQCHKFVLRGHPICVNFTFQPKASGSALGTAAASATREKIELTALVRPQTAKPTSANSRLIGKVLIKTMPDSEEDEKATAAPSGRILSTADLIKPNLQGQEKTCHVNGKSPKMKTLFSEKSVDNKIADNATTSFLSTMIKKVKQKEMEEKSKISYEESDADVDGGGSDCDEADDIDNSSNEDDDDSDAEEGDEEEKEDQEEKEAEDSHRSEEYLDDERSPVAGDATQEEVDDESEGEAIDASLKAILSARKASSRALKAPGSKRNWKVGGLGTKRPSGTMPKMLPMPAKRRK